ncbi:MAG: GFA family protein [Xanthobacteraceae bacterium]
MAFASVRREDLRWTRGRPSTFVSSNVAERNFCNACGTPLTYHRVASGSIAVTIGSLDDPEAARPIEQFGIESEHPGPVGSERCPVSVPKTGCVSTALRTSTVIRAMSARPGKAESPGTL